MQTASISERPLPTSVRERLPILDILRGFALFGILLVNMEDFSASNVPGLGYVWTDRPDQIVGWLLRFAAEGKFRAVFSLLFGLGFAMQLERAERHSTSFRMHYVRRASVLFLIGIAHYVLLWEADILMIYALVGMLLLLFAHRSAATAVRAAAILAGVAVTLFGLIALLAHPRATVTPHDGATAPIPTEKVRMVAVYSRGRYKEVVTYRAQQLGTYLGRNILLAPLTLMLFLVGLAAGKAGIARNPAAYRALVRRLFGGCLILGLAANAIVAIYASRLMSLPKLARLSIAASYVLGGPALALAYISGLTLLLLNPAWQARLHPLAAPGRLALTNYLLQSVICGLLFYGYGLGWYNHVSPLAGVGLCVTIFLLLTAGSSWWLRRYRYGPAEWLWRSLTYGRLLAMRASRPEAEVRQEG